MSFSTDDIAKAGRTTLRGARLWDMHDLFGKVERDGNGARVFTQDHIDRARIIGALQMWGMTIAMIKGVLASKFPNNYVVDALGELREFLDEVEAVVSADRPQVFDL